MAARHDIRNGMQVLGSDGGMVGRVTGLHGDHVHVEPDAPEPGPGYFVVPRRWVARVDDHVHLDRAAALVRDTWRQEASTEAPGPQAAGMGEPSRGRSWLWTLGAILVLIALYFVFAD